MPLKKLQEKCKKKSGEQDYPIQYQIDSHFPQQQQKTNQFPPKERLMSLFIWLQMPGSRISIFESTLCWIRIYR